MTIMVMTCIILNNKPSHKRNTFIILKSMTEAQKEWNKLEKTAAWLKDKGFTDAKAAVVLGSGLGGLADKVDSPLIVDTSVIPGYPSSSVEGHQGRMLCGTLSGLKCLVFQGRVHYYEGYSPLKICAPVIVSRLLGVETVILTNASGSINGRFPAGTLMLIEDFISVFHHNSLRGLIPAEIRGKALNINEFIYPPYTKIARKAAVMTGVNLEKGTLGVCSGPTYETAAEVRMLQFAGADAASMSTVPEIIMAKYLGMKILAISCLTNMGTGLSPTPLTHEEVQEVAARVADSFEKLMLEIIDNIRQIPINGGDNL